MFILQEWRSIYKLSSECLGHIWSGTSIFCSPREDLRSIKPPPEGVRETEGFLPLFRIFFLMTGGAVILPLRRGTPVQTGGTIKLQFQGRF